jgi:protein gp37
LELNKLQKSKIEWCDYTWNPVTGCLHGCPYCYAKRIAKRFESRKGHELCTGDGATSPICFPKIESGICDMKYPLFFTKDCGASKVAIAPFPNGFMPTFHRYRLDEPQHLKKPANIFVVSMGDLFGEWVPDEWIQAVFEACEKAPQHRYLFLTKNPWMMSEMLQKGILINKNNFFYGTSDGVGNLTHFTNNGKYNYSAFLSIEPLLQEWHPDKYSFSMVQWVIVGAETGNRKGKVIPQREWIENIANQCKENNVPLFMKDSLKDIWGEPLIQEFPW